MHLPVLSRPIVALAVALLGFTAIRVARADDGARIDSAGREGCKDRWQCAVIGWCTATDGGCRAASIADCAGSEYCLEQGKCVADGGECVQERAARDGYEEPHIENNTRFRFGLSPMVGGGSAGDRLVGTLGGEMRAGVQIDDYFAVVAQAHVVGWEVNGEEGGATGASLLADLTLGDHFYLSAGGGYNYVFGGDDKWHSVAHDLSAPGFVVRVGAYPAARRCVSQRVGLQTGVEVHTYLSDAGTIAAAMGTVGVELF